MLTGFFSKDNATAKLASSLVLAASILSLIAQNMQVSESISLTILLLAGIASIAAQFFQANKVISNSLWLTLAYMIADYLATTQLPFPQSKELFVTVAGVLKLLAGFTTHEPGDTKPPTDVPVKSSN